MSAKETAQPINPVSDRRVEHKIAVVNGITYHYLLGEPKDGRPKGTIFLIHGWPDLSIGWKYQIPFLLELGFRVVAPDMMGYGGTDAPKYPPNDIRLYGYKRAADDIAELAKQVGASKIILGGHDWGGMIVWRTALWHPELVTHVFAVCTPYTPPLRQYISTEDLVKGSLPQFAYQLHLASPEVEASVKSDEQLRQFFHGIFGAKGPNGELAFDPYKGVLFDNLAKVGKTKLLSEKDIDYYVQQYSRNGLHGPVNWYRTRRLNYEDDLGLQTSRIDRPTLFIQATHDSVLLPSMAKGMGKYLSRLTLGEVAASHWALTQKPNEVNGIIKQWLEKEVLGGRSSL